MSKRLYMSLIFSNLVVIKKLSSNHRMYNLYTKFVKILEICKQFITTAASMVAKGILELTYSLTCSKPHT